MECLKCRSKQPLSAVFRVANNKTYICAKCGISLEIHKTKSWSWGAIIGFISVVIPANIYLINSPDIIGALLVGLIGGIISICGVSVFIYFNVRFKNISN